MFTTNSIFETSDITDNDYCVFGLATCFLKNDGEFDKIQIIEPIPSSALEILLKGIPTSYELICAMPIGSIIKDKSLTKTVDFPEKAKFCDLFIERTVAAVRTYKRNSHICSQFSLGSIKKDLNFSLEKKRVLNTIHSVTVEDNVKQHSHTHATL
ncbi:MAG: hypothetical protein JXR06_05065 [Candidatus Atelocyanobacterium thalassa]|uniref:Uncharacterized protein n=1 Tax=Candidatus Atelocyanobacterium thalassa isolate SIO64986 TaxID=1527444 RepID=A0A086CHI5_9CHRO|nr:MAG: hypothetical protein ucyna2_00525 [Candidatus Atelocyanobacterium thalassa isolate SIO64986]